MTTNEDGAKPITVEGATRIELSADNAGWHAVCPLNADGDRVEIGLRVLTCNESEDGAVWLNEPPKNSTTRWCKAQASRAGWHRLRATQGRDATHADVVITWESARLAKPPQAQGGHHERFVWLSGDPDNDAERNLETARELARYFILDLKEQCELGRELDNRRFVDDPYPEVNALALEHEFWLYELTWRPWKVDEEGTDQVIEAGRRARELLDQETL